MIGIDTNVLLRFILADDPDQFERCKTFIGGRSIEDPAFVSLFVLAETFWVLNRRYRYSSEVIARSIRKLLDTEEFVFEDEDFVESLLSSGMTQSVGISDHVVAHIASRSGCSKTVTFDTRAARAVPGMELLQ